MAIFGLFITSMLLLTSGCISIGTTFDDDSITLKKIRGMSAEQCDIILQENTSTNVFRFDQDLKVFVTPCTPRMLLAYNWKKRQRHLISDETFLQNTDRQARNCLGVAFDPAGDQFLDKHGKPISDISQLDSMLFILSIETKTDLASLVGAAGLPDIGAFLSSSSLFSLFPNLSDLKDKIWLQAEGETISAPFYVRGGNAQFLTREQDYVAMFPFTEKMQSSLHNHQTIELVVHLGELKVTFPVKFML